MLKNSMCGSNNLKCNNSSMVTSGISKSNVIEHMTPLDNAFVQMALYHKLNDGCKNDENKKGIMLDGLCIVDVKEQERIIKARLRDMGVSDEPMDLGEEEKEGEDGGENEEENN